MGYKFNGGGAIVEVEREACRAEVLILNVQFWCLARLE